MNTKLYPPQIAGALPAFCKTYDVLQDLSVGAKITIPFIMNAGVGEAEVKGFALRLKTASSNTYVCPVRFSTNWDKEKSTVTFELGAEYANALNEGQFYKVQIAYYTYETQTMVNPTTGKIEETVIDITNSDYFIIGYYSTVGIIKCISKPKIFIEGYSSDSVNLFTGTFLGVYDQTASPDKTEKVYSYRFDFYDLDDNITQTSGELIHNINNDSEYDYSIDRYICNDFIQPTEVYKLVYTVTTMNGYVASSPRYKVTANASLAPGRYMEVVTIPVIEDGCIDVSCKGELGLSPEGKMEEALYYGEFVLSRASEEDGYVEWEKIQEFRLSNQKPSTFHFYDFSVKQGIKYVYSIQQFNMSKLHSTRILSPKVSVDFEDMFLFDGERSLKIRFNPKVSSFKTTHLEKKIETIGNKYPFVFRNGAVGYKEFPVEGLISYHIDENQRFLKREELYDSCRINEESREKDLEHRYIAYNRGIDLTEDNVLLERKFKIAVLDWLNNGEPKLFKSATEGNFIVRLVNTSLTPNDTLGRMIHTFKATAIEVADCTLENLKKYGFAVGGAINTFVPLWRTYDFNSMDNSLDGRGKELKFDQEVTSFKIEGVLPRTKVYIYYNDSSIPEEVIIGATGAYSFSDSSRRVVKLLFIFENNLNIQGHIECEYIGRRYSNFDAVTGIKLQTIVSNQVIGVNPALEYMKDSSPKIPNFELAVKALADTNYRTYLNKYLINIYIENILDGKSVGGGLGNEKDWRSLLKDLDLLETVDSSIVKKDTSFDPSDTIQYIKTDFDDFNRNKLTVLNMEQAKIRQRELIPVYVVPYEMVTPEAWRKMPTKIYKSKTVHQNDTLVCTKVQYYDENNNLQYKDYFSRKDYEDIEFPTWELLFSTTPFGRPYPIDELVTYLTLQNKKNEQLIDKHFVYIIYKYNKNTNSWYPIDNYSAVAPTFSGSYYDPYRKELLQNYKTTFYINDKYRYDPITKKDVVKHIYNNNSFNVLRANGLVLNNQELYIKTGNEYVIAAKEIDYPDAYTLWFDDKEPEVYYMRTDNSIDIQYSKEMTFDQLGEVNALGISNGIISEQTFQLQIMDYYTEVNDIQTKEAKQKYLDAANFLRNVFKMFNNIEEADVKRRKYETLYQLYDTLLTGNAEGKSILNAYDFLLMFIMLETESIKCADIQQFFLPRLIGIGTPTASDITYNLKRLVGQYKGEKSIPIEILIEEMFYTENENLKQAYNNFKNIFMIIYNQITKRSELQLIEGEENDLLSLLTDKEIIGLDSKYLSLQKMHDLIAAQIGEKEIEATELALEFQTAQNNILNAYSNYNKNLGKIAAVEWIKQLRQQNNPDTTDLLDFITTVEQIYSDIANGMNMESQYQQEQIDKWKQFYDNNYKSIKELMAENIILQKIQSDNDDDPNLDKYLQEQLDENMKKVFTLASQMEIIEKTPYQGVDIITKEDLELYPNRQLDLVSDYNYLYTKLIEPNLETWKTDIEVGLQKYEGIIDADDIKLIAVIQDFILEADIYELFKGFKNWGNNFIFSLMPKFDWITLRNNYIEKLPPSVIASLERNILRINNTSDGLNYKLDMSNEDWYLFSKDINFKEYKNRVSYVLDAARAIAKNIMNTQNLKTVIDATSSISGFQIDNYVNMIYGNSIDTLNDAIKDVNALITKYIGILRSHSRITDNNNQKWKDLLNEFDEVYPFASYIKGEPTSPIDYQQKIEDAQNLEKSVFEICYPEEIEPIQNAVDTEYEYILREEVILPTTKEINKYTFILTYRYFSDFYWKFIGEILDSTSGNGMFWWYIDVVLHGDIEYQKNVLEDMKKLLEEYSIKTSNYNEKRNRYLEQYENAKKIFEQYQNEFPDVFDYYFSNAGDQYELIDKAITNAKKYWNLFILELDLGYKREVERGMYG